MAKFWATLKVHDENKLDGNPWRYMRYKVEAEPVKIYKLDCFIFYSKPLSMWVVHEVSTGSFMGGAKSHKNALNQAAVNYRSTPDLADQIKNLSTEFNGNVKNCAMLTTMEAERLLRSYALLAN